MSDARKGAALSLSVNAVQVLSRLLVLVAVIVFGCFVDESFLTMRNASNIITNASILIVLGIGQTIAVITAGPDLSSGSIMTICGVLAAILMKTYEVHFVLAIFAALCFGALLGMLNGYMIAYIGIPSFISTYGLQWAIFGFAYVMLHGYVLYDFADDFRFIGNGTLFNFLQMPIVVMVVLVALGVLLLRKTTLGRECYAVGSNRVGAVMSGINAKLVILRVFIISGVLSAFTGILFVARMNAVQSDIGSAYLLPVLATVYMGGTSANGGSGGIFGTAVSALVITIVTNCMNLLAVPSELRNAIIGTIIILTVLLDTTVKNRVAAGKQVTA